MRTTVVDQDDKVIDNGTHRFVIINAVERDLTKTSSGMVTFSIDSVTTNDKERVIRVTQTRHYIR